MLQGYLGPIINTTLIELNTDTYPNLLVFPQTQPIT